MENQKREKRNILKKTKEVVSNDEASNEGVTNKETPDYKRNYNTIQNMFYVMKGTFKWQKIPRPFIVISAFAEASLSFIWVIIPKYIVEIAEQDKGLDALIKVIILSAIIQLCALAIHTYMNHEIWWKFISARMKFISIKMRKSLTMNYEHLENPQMLDSMENYCYLR